MPPVNLTSTQIEQYLNEFLVQMERSMSPAVQRAVQRAVREEAEELARAASSRAELASLRPKPNAEHFRKALDLTARAMPEDRDDLEENKHVWGTFKRALHSRTDLVHFTVPHDFWGFQPTKEFWDLLHEYAGLGSQQCAFEEGSGNLAAMVHAWGYSSLGDFSRENKAKRRELAGAVREVVTGGR